MANYLAVTADAAAAVRDSHQWLWECESFCTIISHLIVRGTEEERVSRYHWYHDHTTEIDRGDCHADGGTDDGHKGRRRETSKDPSIAYWMMAESCHFPCSAATHYLTEDRTDGDVFWYCEW